MVEKKECDNCKNKFKQAKLHKHYSGTKWCKRCLRKHGNNKFYIPKIKGQKEDRKFIKMTMTEDEKKELWSSYIRMGMSEEQATLKIKKTQNYLFWQQRRRMWNKPLDKKEDVNKNLIEGLKNAK